MTGLVLYPLLTAALYYLGARAMITSWLWSRYPLWLDTWASCSACSGFWYGLGVALLLGRVFDIAFLGLDPLAWWTPIVVAFASMIWTPMVAFLQESALRGLNPPAE